MWLILLFIGAFALETQAQEQSEKRVSLTFNYGVTYGLANGGTFGPLAGDFNVASFRQPIYGGSFQYAFTPAWSINTGLQFGEFTNQFTEDPPFQNDFFNVTVKGVTNLNNLLNLRWGASRFVNPYFSFGLGMMRSQIVTDDLDSEDLSLMATGGAGLMFYLFRGADLFVQYDYHVVGSDLLDGVSGDGGTDKFAALNAGIRINFGPSGTKHASWPPSRERRVREPAPRPEVPEPEPELEPEVEPKVEPEPEVILDESTRRQLSAIEMFRQSPLMTSNRFIEEARERAEIRRQQKLEEERRIAEMRREEERRAAEMRMEEQRRAEAEAARVITDEPAPGHYVQVFSFRSRAYADQLRDDLIELLNEHFDDASQRVVIHRYGDYHRVLVGPFTRFSQARNAQQEFLSQYEEAFIITYPRQYQEE